MVEINGKQLCENCFEGCNTPFCTHCGYKAGMCDPTMLAPGSVLLGKYIVGRIMGKGGFGVTYLAYDVTANRKVAIKEFFPYGVALRTSGTTTVSVASMENADAFKLGAEKFYNEAKLVAKFNGNPNIVGVYEFFYENDTVYFAMEYLQGQTLKEYIQQNGTLKPGQAVLVAQSVANALMAAHSSNVLHRDISPDNIIICDNGDVKLIDFGAARQVVAEHSQSFSVILKPGFAPLEQYQKKGNQGPWTDIYSLGATIYYALTEDIPEDPMSRMDDDEEFSSNKYNVDPELWNVIAKATQLKIDDRYGDVFRLKNDLNALSITPEPLVEVTASEQKMPEFNTAVPYGMTQNAAPQTASQPVAVGAPVQQAPVQQAPIQQAPVQQVPTTAYGQPVPPPPVPPKKSKGKTVGIIAGVAAAAAAAIIIPISVNGSDKSDTSSTPAVTSTPTVTSKPTTTTSTPAANNGVEKVTNKEYTYTFSDGTTEKITYTGDWVKNAPNGNGYGVFGDGTYDGKWENGKENGQGKMTFTSGNTYDGWFKDGKYDGQGTFTWANGDKYVGGFKDSKKNGHGIDTWSTDNGYAVFEGEYKNDLANGQCKRTNYDQNNKVTSIYEGMYIDGDLNGQGKYTYYKDGYKYQYYEGEFADSKWNGKGKLTVYDANGNVTATYTGEFKDGKYVGPVTETVTNQRYGNGTYTGEWANNAPNGQGTAVYDDGNKYVGEFKDGKRDGQGTYTWADGSKYVGEFKDGKFDGQGTFTWVNGDVFEGEYKDGKQNGHGKYTWASGGYREGEWKDGKLEGQVTYYDKNGKKTIETWKNGEKVS